MSFIPYIMCRSCIHKYLNIYYFKSYTTYIKKFEQRCENCICIDSRYYVAIGQVLTRITCIIIYLLNSERLKCLNKYDNTNFIQKNISTSLVYTSAQCVNTRVYIPEN